MKKVLLLSIPIMLSAFFASAQNIAINTSGAAANLSALLDVDATNRGMLIPRVSLTALGTYNGPITAGAPTDGLIVYNTNNAVGNGRGFYYWSTFATSWINLLDNQTPYGYILDQFAGAQAGANHWVSGNSRATEVYAANWFRNDASGTGLYNQVTGAGIYSPAAGLMSTYNGSNFRIEGNLLIGNVGSSSTYGSITVQGEKNGWSGINFKNAAGANLKTFMITSNYSGIYNSADNNWDYYWNSGALEGMNGYTPANQVMRMTPNLHLNSMAGNAVILNWDNGTTGNTMTLRVGNGAGADVFDVYANGNVNFTGLLMPNGNPGTTGQALISQGGSPPVWGSGTAGQQFATVFSTATITLNSASPYTLIPGLTQAITIPATGTYDMYIFTDGGCQLSAAAPVNNGSQLEISIWLDGVAGRYYTSIPANTNNYVQCINTWATSFFYTGLAPGAHTVQVFARVPGPYALNIAQPNVVGNYLIASLSVGLIKR